MKDDSFLLRCHMLNVQLLCWTFHSTRRPWCSHSLHVFCVSVCIPAVTHSLQISLQPTRDLEAQRGCQNNIYSLLQRLIPERGTLRLGVPIIFSKYVQILRIWIYRGHSAKKKVITRIALFFCPTKIPEKPFFGHVENERGQERDWVVTSTWNHGLWYSIRVSDFNFANLE